MMADQINSFEELYRKHNYQEKPKCCDLLWHYTNVDGLLGIVKHNKLCFWFTRSDCLNDKSEGSHILDLYREKCQKLLKSQKIDNLFYQLISDIAIPEEQFIHYPTPPEEDCQCSVTDCVPCDAFVCSFSSKEDSIDMWRYYSKGKGGYGLKCLGVLFEKLKRYEHSKYDKNAMFSCIKSYRVIYKNSEKFKILKSIILDAYDLYQKTKEVGLDAKKDIRNFLISVLKELQFKFKHECFESEEEYRFVFYLPKIKPKQLDNKMPQIQHRPQDGIIIPYIELEIDSTSCLNEVLISPNIESSLAIKTTEDYLESCGFECSVRKSELPVLI